MIGFNMEKYAVKGLPWANGLGKNVTDCNTASEVMEKANLNWFVKKCSMVAEMPFSINGNNELTDFDILSGAFTANNYIYRCLPNAYATYRTDINVPLGYVKNKYEVIQNIDAFNFFDEAIGEDSCKWESAGLLGYGHKIFVTAKLAFTTEINTPNGKDPVENYLVFSNSHDGTSSVTVMFTPIRVFCTNCLNAGIEDATSYIRIRHTESAKQRLDRGAEVLRIACEKAASAKDLYTALAHVKASDDTVMQYIADLQLTENERIALYNYDRDFGYRKLIDHNPMALEVTGISTRKANIITSMYNYYHEGVGQEKIVGTAWGAYNAVTGYYANVANLEGEKRFESMLYGNAHNIMRKALLTAHRVNAA